MVSSFYKSLCLLLVLGAISSASALDLGTSTPQGIKIIQGEETLPSDILILNKPNSSGISYNLVPRFYVNRPLKIANTPDSYGLNSMQAAKLIVIHANEISLTNGIEVLGETADILLISSNSGARVNCTNCRFVNFGRVTLAAALGTLNSSISRIGELSNTTSGAVNINSLSAPGVASIEILANDVTTQGLINTNLRARYHAAGGYELSSTGGLVVGSGGVNIYARRLTVNYETQKLVTQMVSSTSLLRLYGNITSASINISAAAPLDVRATLSTKSDILSTSVYRGKLSPTKEGINLTTLGGTLSAGGITLNGTLLSDNEISISSSGNLYLNRQINAKHLNLTVNGKLHNSTSLVVTSTQMVADQFENNGSIKGSSISIVAVKDVQNSFGGKILAETINLASSTSLVRNGSQYPYRPAANGALVLKPDALDELQLSTVNELNYLSATKVADLNAKIIGKNITIDAYNNFENINPYFVYTKDPKVWVDGIVFDAAAIDRVVLIAEESLKIKAGQYVLNSSAIMGVNLPSKEKMFIVNAPNIANQRYYTRVLGDLATENNTIITNSSGATSTSDSSTNVLQANLYVYSPPGIIYSFAPLQFEFPNTLFASSSAGFINNTAYFEALSDAHFVGEGVVTSIGLTLEKENYSFLTTTVTQFKECYSYMTPGVNGKCGYTSTTAGNSNGATVATDMERTLFSVAGNIHGAKSNFFGTNHQALDDFKQNLIDGYIEEQRQLALIDRNPDDIWTPYFNYRKSSDGKSITVETLHATSVSGAAYPPNTSKTIKVWDLLVQKFAEIKAAFISAMDAFMAWFNS